MNWSTTVKWGAQGIKSLSFYENFELVGFIICYRKICSSFLIWYKIANDLHRNLNEWNIYFCFSKMTIDFYYMPGSGPCRSVLATAKALGIELNLKFLNLREGEHLKPEFVKVRLHEKVKLHSSTESCFWKDVSILFNSRGKCLLFKWRRKWADIAYWATEVWKSWKWSKLGCCKNHDNTLSVKKIL